MGWEYGRRHEASLDQYVPFTAHFEVDGETSSIGVMVPEETAWIDVREVGDHSFELRAAGRDGRVGLRIVTGSEPLVSADRVTLGPVEIGFEVAPDDIAHEHTPIGSETHSAGTPARWSQASRSRETQGPTPSLAPVGPRVSSAAESSAGRSQRA